MTAGDQLNLFPQSLTNFAFLVVLFCAVAFFILTWLALRGGHGYTVQDTESHAADYGNVIKEGHGGITAFLAVSYVILFGWMIFYLVERWGEFGRLFNLWRLS